MARQSLNTESTTWTGRQKNTAKSSLADDDYGW
jgi:hypothetical protein